jgi:tetratricopeptide (TPR) repeat protein
LGDGDYKNATKNYKEAIKYLNTATGLKQDYFWALYHKGYTYSQMQIYTEAADSYKNATKAAENASEEANKENNKKNFDQAKEQLATANEAYAAAWNNKGLALNKLGRTTEAEAAFAKAKELGYTGDLSSD